MKMTLHEIQTLDYPVDKLLLVSICGTAYQVFAEDQGVRFAIYDDDGNVVKSKNLEDAKDLIKDLKCKRSVLYQQLPYDEACVSNGEMSPAMEIPLGLH